MCLLLNEAKKNDPDISCFRRTDSLNQGWIVRCGLAWEKKLTLTGFESLRDDCREVTLPTEPFNTSASGARFSTTTLASRMKQLSWLLRSKRFRSKYECNCGFCLQSRSETTRCPAIKGYYAKLTPPCVQHKSWLNAAESDSVLWFEYFIKSDTWFD